MKTNGLPMTLAGLMLFTASLYAQQEVSPSWYDPWQAPDKVTAHVSQSPVAKHTASVGAVMNWPPTARLQW